MLDLQATFEKHDAEGSMNWKFAHPKLSLRRDLHVFLLLNRLVPGDSDIIADANQIYIYFDTDIDKLAKVITEEQVIELVRCGVFWNSDRHCLCMFV